MFRRTFSQFLRFAAVGAVGFVVDAAVLLISIRGFGLNLYAGRIVSYLMAATTTWAMNRTFTFRGSTSASHLNEWYRFVVFNAIGACVNLGTYAWMVHQIPLVHDQPLLGVACGSMAGLLINFSTAKLLVFRTDAPTPR